MHVAIPVDLNVKINSSKHSKSVCDAFENKPIPLKDKVSAVISESESEVMKIAAADIKDVLEKIIEVKGGGLEIQDFYARVWIQEVKGGRFYVSNDAGTVISFSDK